MTRPWLDWRFQAAAAAVLGVGASLALLASGVELPESVALPAWARPAAWAEHDVRLFFADRSLPIALSAATLPYLVVVAIHSLTDVGRVRLVLQTLVRVLLAAVFGLVLAEPALERPRGAATVVLAIDGSRSIDDGQWSAAQALVDTAWETVARQAEQGIDPADRARLRLVVYGARARSMAPELAGERPPRLVRPADDLASDHAAALALAAASIDPDTEGRVVLIGDGLGTAAERRELAAAAAGLQAAGSRLFVHPTAPLALGDVAIETVRLPGDLRVGHAFDVEVVVATSRALTLTIALDRDGTEIGSREVELREGRQTLRFPARVDRPGPVWFSARIDASSLATADDRFADNDRATAVAEAKGPPRVLLVSGPDPGGALARALRGDRLDVEVRSPAAVPTHDAELAAWDLVILSDVPARTVPIAAQQGLRRFVDGGGGLIMIGGESSFGLGGWSNTAVEDVLPVHFEGELQRQQPTLALILVIDKSGSMASEDKLDLVKEAARATARTLDATDELGVVAFDQQAHVLVRLQPASSRLRISGDIRRLTAGGGTHALPALREAYLQLSGSRALVKHVILLSDGQSPEAGVVSLLDDLRNAGITVSAVGVGSGAGKDFLARVAERGRGRYYFSQDGTDVPRIFSRETSEVTRNAVTERELFPRASKSAQVLRGIDFDGAPGLRGIVAIEPKPQAEVLLRTHVGDPLLVRGRHGLGRTAAFASDAKARWAVRWIGWSGFPKLWSQLARDLMRQESGAQQGATVEVHDTGSGGHRVVIDVESAGGWSNDLAGVLEVADPELAHAPREELPLSITAPGRFSADLAGFNVGHRLLSAKLWEQGGTPDRVVARAAATLSVPYPRELAPERLIPDPTFLEGLVRSIGPIPSMGEIVTMPVEASTRTARQSIWPWILGWLLIPLVVVDVALRRIPERLGNIRGARR